LAFERVPPSGLPDILRMHAPKRQILIDLAHREGIFCQADTPTALLPTSIHYSIRGWQRLRCCCGQRLGCKAIRRRTEVDEVADDHTSGSNAPRAQGLFRFTRFQVHSISAPKAGKQSNSQVRLRSITRCSPPAPCAENTTAKNGASRCWRFPSSVTDRARFGFLLRFPPSLSEVRGRPTLTYRDIPEEVAGEMTAKFLDRIYSSQPIALFDDLRKCICGTWTALLICANPELSQSGAHC